MGFLLQKEGDLQSAIDHLRQSVELDTNLDLAHCNLAGASIELERYDEAVEHAEVANRLRPKRVTFLDRPGVALQRSGDGDRALAASHVRKVLMREPERPEALRLHKSLPDEGNVTDR